MRNKSFLSLLAYFVAAFTVLMMLTIMMAHAQTPTPILPPGYEDPVLKPLAAALGVKTASVQDWMARLFAFGVVAKLFAGRLNKWLSGRLAWQVEQHNSDADSLILGILSSRAYRGVALVIDLGLSVDLPTVKSYQEQLDAQNTKPASADSVIPPAGQLMK